MGMAHNSWKIGGSGKGDIAIDKRTREVIEAADKNAKRFKSEATARIVEEAKRAEGARKRRVTGSVGRPRSSLAPQEILPVPTTLQWRQR